MADSVKAPEAKVRVRNVTKSVIVSGQIRIAPGQTIEIPESKFSEGLKKLIGAGLERV